MGGQERVGKGRQDEADTLLATLATAEAITDPYPLYARLRALAPAHPAPSGAVFVTRYEDCAAVTRDPAFRAQSPGWRDRVMPGWRDRSARVATSQAMEFRDPPDHTRLRRLVSASFTPRQVSNMREDVERLTGRVLNLIADGGCAGSAVNLREVLASSLPVSVIGTLVGVPPADWVPLQEFTSALLEVSELSAGPAELAAADRAAAGLREYFADLVAERRRAPRDDLATALLAARKGNVDGLAGSASPAGLADAGSNGHPGLTEDELLQTLAFVFMAGGDTMINLLTNGTAALLAHPEQADALRDDPRLQSGAVDEVLRYDAPVQFVGRVASVDTTIGGVPVRRDGLIIAMLGAANRDPARFPSADSFDISRTGTTVLSFGGGIHYCLGALLARLEAGTFFPALLERFPTLRLAGLPRRRGLVHRGFSHLPVAAR
jgi:cytochrome P450